MENCLSFRMGKMDGVEGGRQPHRLNPDIVKECPEFENFLG